MKTRMSERDADSGVNEGNSSAGASAGEAARASDMKGGSKAEIGFAPLGLPAPPTKRSRVRIGLLLLAACALLVAAITLLPLDLQAIRSRVLPATKVTTVSRDAAAPVRVRVAPVRAEDVPIYLSGIGTVQAYNTVNITTRVDGQITQILFQEGQDVKRGDPLAIIDPRPYQAQLEQEQATLLKDQALLDQATADLQRYETLEQKSSIAIQQADDQRFLVRQDRAQVQLDQAEVAYAQTQVEYTTVRSPIDGRTGIRQVDQGNIVYAALNTTIVVLTQLRPISVIFTFPSKDVAAAKLTLGQTHVPVIAYAADHKTPIDRGTIELVDNVIDPTTGNIKLKASFPNDGLHLWPGDFVNGRAIVETRHQGLTVPPAALRHGPRGDYVWVVRDDNTVEAHSVRVRQSADDRILIERNLKPGQRVVTEGHFLLENGRRVEIIEPGPGSAPAAQQGEPQPEADVE
jgi:multidrug efflux system membrane fusion protein